MADINKVVNIKVESDIDNVTKDVKKLNKGLKGTSEASSEMKSQLNTISGGKLSALTGIIGKVRLAFVSLRTAIIASGIGALAIAVLAVGRAFKDSEEGQNKFAKLMGVIGAVVGNLTDLLADLGEKIISVFENPKEAIKSFSKLVKENISNRLEGLTELIPKLGAAINLLFKGEFVEAGKVAGDAIAKVTLGVEDFTDKVIEAKDAVVEFGKEQVREGNAAARVADMRATAEKEERKLLLQRATLENKIANLRLKSREEDKFGAEERKQALLDAQKLEDILLEKETKVLKLRADAQTLENTFSRSNKENLNEEARLQAAVIRQQAARTNSQRQTQRELNRLNKEISADNKRILAEEQKAIDDLEKFKKDLADKNDDERIAKINQEKEDRLSKLEELKLEEEEKNQLKLEVEQRYIDDLKAIKEADRIAQKEKDDKLAEEEAKRKQDEADNKAKLLQEEADLEEKRRQEKIATFDTLARLAGEETKMGKALLVAKALLQAKEMLMEVKGTLFTAKQSLTKATVKGAEAGADIAAGQAKTASVGFPQNIPLLVGFAAQAVGIISAVKSATSKVKQVAGSTGASGGGFSSGSIPLPTSFDTVSQTQSQNDNLATSITNQQGSNPIQAYVTSTDVASANALERNRIEDAGF